MEEKTVFQPRPFGSVKAGTRLNGIYEIEKMLAQGGMGEVYRGFNIQTGDIVAIKMIRPEFSNNDEVMELFRREASILHNLVHEAIVRYFLFSVDPIIGRAYLAMEFVDGLSLSDRLTSGPLSMPELTILRKRIASALETAHRLGVIHRDISSDNIILPDADVRNAKIIDFGIARSTEVGKKTIIGSGFAGKYNYVSPEQLGMAGGDVTSKSDIYSLGLVLAEAARGRALDMSGSQAEVIDKRRVVPDLSDVDPALRPLLQAMLQPLPENRPESMAAVAEWTPQTLPPPAGRRHTVRGLTPAMPKDAALPAPSSSGRMVAIVGVAIALVSLGGVAFVFKDDLLPGTRGPAAPGVASKPSAALPPLPPLPAPPPEGTAQGGKLPPLGSPAPQPAAPSPATPPQPETAQTAPEPRSATEQAPSQATAEANPPSSPPSPRATPPATPAQPANEPDTSPRARQTALDLPAATVGAPYRTELPAFADPSGKGLSLSAEQVPDGLSFRDLGDGKGVVEGAPTRPGAAAMRVVAVNRDGKSAEMTASLTVADKPQPAPAPAPPAKPAETAKLEAPRPSLQLAVLDPATVGTDYSANLPAFSSGPGASPMTLKAEPPPPAGLAFADLGSGQSQITGKPATAGSFAFNVVATTAAGLASRMAVKLDVSPAKFEPSPADLKAAAFIRDYAGGDCFLVKPLPGAGGQDRAYLSVGDELAPFVRFEDAFRKAVGADPKLSLRPIMIMPPECAALDLIRLGDASASSAPRVTLADYRVGRNRPLMGTVANLGGRRLYLMRVDNEGKAYRIEAAPKPGGDSATFSLPLPRDAGPVGPVQLVLAMTSDKPIAALDNFRSGDLKALAPALVEQAKTAAAAVGADFFMFVN